MLWMWLGFIALVLLLVAADLFFFNRTAHVIGLREAIISSLVWIALALAFNVFIFFAYHHHWHGLGLHSGSHHPHGLNGHEAAALFFTGYVVEESLSVDNLFVMSLLFAYFCIPPKFQHRVLVWGILGAQAMRGTMILLGAALIHRFEWILYVFGVFLLYTAWRMVHGSLEPDPKKNRIIRIARRFFPVTHEIHGTHFVVRESQVLEEVSTPAPVNAPQQGEAGNGETGTQTSGARTFAPAPVATTGPAEPCATEVPDVAPPADRRKGRWVLTPLALALIVVETTDLLFAVDSIPAIFAITTDPFLVFTSNIFAVLGLRSLYSVLVGVLAKFKYLETSLAVILSLVGGKMLLRHWTDRIPGISFWMLAAVAVVLGAGIVASIVASRRENAPR